MIVCPQGGGGMAGGTDKIPGCNLTVLLVVDVKIVSGQGTQLMKPKTKETV